MELGVWGGEHGYIGSGKKNKLVKSALCVLARMVSALGFDYMKREGGFIG